MHGADVADDLDQDDGHEGAGAEQGHPPGQPCRGPGQHDDGEGEYHDEHRTDRLQPGTPQDRVMVLLSEGGQLCAASTGRRPVAIDRERDAEHARSQQTGYRRPERGSWCQHARAFPRREAGGLLVTCIWCGHRSAPSVGDAGHPGISNARNQPRGGALASRPQPGRPGMPQGLPVTVFPVYEALGQGGSWGRRRCVPSCLA
jgi:hypothetical protein